MESGKAVVSIGSSDPSPDPHDLSSIVEQREEIAARIVNAWGEIGLESLYMNQQVAESLDDVRRLFPRPPRI